MATFEVKFFLLPLHSKGAEGFYAALVRQVSPLGSISFISGHLI